MANNYFTAWSYSRLRDYEQCPLRAKLKYIDKLPEPESPAMVRGKEIHSLAEGYIKGTIRRIPKELKNFEALFKELRKALAKDSYPVYVENQFAVNSEWESTGWFDRDCWLRLVTDVTYIQMVLNQDTTLYAPHAWVIDWKTGKNDDRMRDSYEEQLELFALGTFIRFPNVHVVHPALHYLDDGSTYVPEVGRYERNQLEKLQKKWFKKAKPMMNDRKFAPKANNGCRWCPYRKENDGPCKF